MVVKPRLLRYIDHALRSNKLGQYFVTINVDELLDDDINQFINEKSVVAKLDRSTDENRFLVLDIKFMIFTKNQLAELSSLDFNKAENCMMFVHKLIEEAVLDCLFFCVE